MNAMCEDQDHMLSQLTSEWISGLLHGRKPMLGYQPRRRGIDTPEVMTKENRTHKR